MTKLDIIIATSLSLAASFTQAENLTATPYRPTVSNPAELSALNHLELEFGSQFNQYAEAERRSSLPFLAKYPFAEQWGLLIGGEAWLENTDATGNHNGYGNTALLLKHYHPISQTLALGIEAGAMLPTASRSVGEGHTDYLGNLIVSQDLNELRIDLNAGLTIQPYQPKASDQLAYSWAVAASHPLSERWGIAGEFSGVFYPERHATTQWLTTANYAITPQLVIDFGHTIGLTQITDDYTVFAGFTWLLAP